MFYISTFGGSASSWLALSLSLHPEVVCFHGSKSWPPAPPGTVPDLDPVSFAAGLRHMFGTCRGMKVFGAIHGFNGLEAKEAIEAEGGAFTALIRHPIMRIDSLFHTHVRMVEDYQ